MSAWVNDLRRSQNWVYQNLDIVLPMLHTDREKLFPCEGEIDELKQHLDQQCGTDYFIQNQYGNTFAVGSRFQNDKRQSRKFEIFTIRAERESGTKTEYEKLKEAIDRDMQRPQLTMQGYIGEDGRVDRMAVARTKDIVEFIDLGYAHKKHTCSDQDGQSGFWVVYWDKFIQMKYAIRIYRDGNVMFYANGKTVENAKLVTS